MLMTLLPEEQHTATTRPVRPWIVIAATAIAVGTNAVGTNAVGAAIGAQSEQDRAETLVDPADYAFSIWGLIFLANVVFAAYQALPGQRTDQLLDRVAAPYVAGQVFATVFAVAALIDSHPLAQASTVLYFAAAVLTYVLLGVGLRDDGWARRLCAWLPASMSAAWLLAATIVVIGGLVQIDLELTPPFGTAEGWAAAAVATAGGIAASLLGWRHDYAFGAVTVWALVAIARAQSSETVDAAVVAGIAAIALVALGMLSATLANLIRGGRHERHAGAR